MLRYIVILILIGLFGVVVESAGDPQLCLGCPDEWTKLDDRCYKFYGEPISWDDADYVCNEINAELASIHNYDESDVLYEHWKSLLANYTNDKNGYWIGLNDRLVESLFAWSDGTLYDPDVFSMWYPDQPSDTTGTEDCVHVFNRGENDLERQQWNGIQCSSHLKTFFCYINVPFSL